MLLCTTTVRSPETLVANQGGNDQGPPVPTPSILDRFKLTAEGMVMGLAPHLPPVAIQAGFGYIKGRERPMVASINVVNECNLTCAGCYWGRTEGRQERSEMSLEDSARLIDALYQKGVRDFLFIGGEPLMRLEDTGENEERIHPRDRTEFMVRRVAEHGAISTVITNGTYGLPAPGEWPRVHYFVSFDGDGLGMLKVRGKGVFEQARDAARGRKDVILAMTISNLNVNGVEAFVQNAEEWEVGGVVFSFATPQVGDKQWFYLSDEEKERTVQALLRLKEQLGDFVAMSTRAIELLRPSEVAQWSPDCPTFFAISMTSEGEEIERCIFGPEGDCPRCGCNIYTSAVALREGDQETARMVQYPSQLAGIE